MSILGLFFATPPKKIQSASQTPPYILPDKGKGVRWNLGKSGMSRFERTNAPELRHEVLAMALHG